MSKDARERMAELIEEKYGRLIMKVAFDITGDYDSAEDIKQEVLLKCSKQYKTVEGFVYEGQMYNYVVRAAKNTALNWQDKVISDLAKQERYIEQNRVKLSMNHVDFKAFEEKYGFSDSTVDLLDSLGPLDKEILLLKYYVGLNNIETAEYLNMNVEAVKKRFQRMKIRMKSRVIESEGEKLDEGK